MIKYFFLLSVIVGCSLQEEDQHNTDKVIAKIDEVSITSKTVDSIIQPQLFSLRMSVINGLISQKVAIKEAEKLHHSVQEEINSKDFISTNSSVELSNTLFQDKYRHYIDSVKDYYDISINIQPKELKKVSTDDLLTYTISSTNTGVELIIVSDFECISCQKSQPRLNKLIAKYNNKVNFKFCYFSDYIGEAALAINAASKQNKSKEMYHLIFENTANLHQKELFVDLAQQLQLNIPQFRKNLNDEAVLMKMASNKNKLMDKGIYATPTFILNGLVLDYPYALYTLDYLLENAINEN